MNGLKLIIASPYDYAFPGGVTAHVRALAHHLRLRGHTVTVVAPATQAVAEAGFCRLDVPVSLLPMAGAVARVSVAPTVWGKVGQVLHTIPHDLIHIHEPTLPPLSLAVIHHATVPIVGTFHQYHLRHPYHELTASVTRHFVGKLAARVAVSPAAHRAIASYFPGDYTIIPNGVDLDLFRQAAPLPRWHDGKFNILFVGRLEPRKGLRYLLQAFKQVKAALPTSRLLVVGAFGKAERRLYVRYLYHHRVRGVQFIGGVSEADKARYYRTADLFCAPSTGFESFGMVLTEAMAAGVPLVASDIAGYRDVIQHGLTGWLVPPRNSSALAQAIISLAHDSPRRASLSVAASQAVIPYDWAHITAQLEQLYYDCL